MLAIQTACKRKDKSSKRVTTSCLHGLMLPRCVAYNNRSVYWLMDVTKRNGNGNEPDGIVLQTFNGQSWENDENFPKALLMEETL